MSSSFAPLTTPAALAGHRPQAALAIWLAMLTLMVCSASGLLLPLAGVAAAAGADARIPLSLMIWVALVPAAASWLFISLFGNEPLNRIVRLAIRATTPTCIALLALVALLPNGLRPLTAIVTTLLCSAPTLLGTGLMLRGGRSAGLISYGAGWTLQLLAVALSLIAATSEAPFFPGWLPIAAALATVGCWSFAVIDAALAAHARLDLAHHKAVIAARKYRHVYYSVPIPLISIDRKGHVLRLNEMAEQAFGEALPGGRLNPIAAVLGEEAAETLLRDVHRTGKHVCELSWTRDGVTRVYAIDALIAGDDIELSLVDVSERSELARTMEHLAHHDFLTHSLNRRGLEREIDDLLPDIELGMPASLIYLDLDRFKAINDVFGHAAGDAMVLEVAKRLTDHLPPQAIVGRIGGDEFMAILPAMKLADARVQATRVMNALVRESVDYEGLQLNVEASIGVIEAVPGMRTRELLAYADEACSQSKRAGRGRITVLEPGSEPLINYQAEQRFASQLKFRLPTERMRIYAQPIVPLLRDEAISYEALLRTEDEDGVIESPSRLIAAAERQGAMAAIDRFVLGRTVTHLAEHPAFTRGVGFVSVNLSGMSLNDDRFVADAIALLREHRSVAGRICLEITESVALYDAGSTRRFIDEMRALGALIALDDFGAGYTSFAYLKDLPANLLKIDGQFIVGLGKGGKSAGIVRAIQQVGRELGMRCLAEWVEDEATLQALIDLEIDYAQGFVFSRARPIENWLQESVDLRPLMASHS
ncbi:MAG: putative bifunctional diguanylate cyclase/phosphodiesterase [Lautropia sp.]